MFPGWVLFLFGLIQVTVTQVRLTRSRPQTRWWQQVTRTNRRRLSCFPRKVRPAHDSATALAPKLLNSLNVPEGSSLWSEQLFPEDTNKVSKLFRVNLLYL